MPRARPNRNNDGASQAARNDGTPTNHRKHWLEYIAVILAALGVIVSACAAAFTGWQAWISSDTEERQLRAYLHVLPGSTATEQHADGSMRVIVKPEMKVFGQTPAGMVLPGWDLTIANNPMPENFVFSVGFGKATNVMAPGESIGITEKAIEITREDIEALKADKKLVYQAGSVTYIDVFGKARYKSFCRSANFNSLLQGAWQLCPIHNGADWYSGKQSKTAIPYE